MIQLPTLTGKVDYAVERALREMASAINGLEQHGSAEAVKALQQRVGSLDAQLGQALKKIEILEHKVNVLEAAP